MKERTRGESPGCGFGQRVQYDRNENEPPSIAVVTALAAYHDEDVTASSVRLYDYIDPEALDALFASTHDGRGRSAGKVAFEVDDLAVVVRSDRVEVYPTR
ncbi:HalOD1 output domain-containing protein [Natronococcus wangiae]|uniref:HalOD1 output domain-containing protein n=1 Tax=Natronococcus wangiae TaxID=3068275 RepID=UPI00273E6B9C|nr:HalOD1 output domain-containing protein [Natronococcus sp. AD5]